MKRRKRKFEPRPPLEADPILELRGVKIRASVFHAQAKARMDRIDSLPPQIRQRIHKSFGGLTSTIGFILYDTKGYIPEALKVISRLETSYAKQHREWMERGGRGYGPKLRYSVTRKKKREIEEKKRIAASTDDLLA